MKYGARKIAIFMDFSLFWAGLTQFAGFLAVLQTQYLVIACIFLDSSKYRMI
jgi:hypothetical protein